MRDKVSRIPYNYLASNTTMTFKGVLDKTHNRLTLMQQVNDSRLSSDVEVAPLLIHYDEEFDSVPICFFLNYSTGSMVIATGNC